MMLLLAQTFVSEAPDPTTALIVASIPLVVVLVFIAEILLVSFGVLGGLAALLALGAIAPPWRRHQLRHLRRAHPDHRRRAGQLGRPPDRQFIDGAGRD